MAVYGTEDRHREVRSKVCDFIEYNIIPYYDTLDDVHKVTLMLHFDWVDEKPYDLSKFQEEAAAFIKNMRRSRVCGRNLELSVACYIFRLEVMIIKKNTRLQNKNRHVTYSRLDHRQGHDLFIEGMQRDGVGSLRRATPNQAAEIQSLVMVFSEFQIVSEDEAAAVSESDRVEQQACLLAQKEAAAVSESDSVEQQAFLLAQEEARVGHYELMAMRIDDANTGPSGSGKKVSRKSQKSPNGAAGDQHNVGEGTSDRDKDQGPSSDMQLHIQTLKSDIRGMKEKEYDFIHSSKKKQKIHNDHFDEHTKLMAGLTGDIDAGIIEHNQKLRDIAAQYNKKIQDQRETAMHEICLKQAGLREYSRQGKGIPDPHDKLFEEDLAHYKILAQERYTENLRLHTLNAASSTSVVAKHNITAEKKRMERDDVERQEKLGRSQLRVQKFEENLQDTLTQQAEFPSPVVYDAKIREIRANIRGEKTYQQSLVEHEESRKARLALLEAENNGLGKEWIAANPLLFSKFSKPKPAA
jgi:hypothetical protein